MWQQAKRFVQLGLSILLSTAVILVGWSMLNESKIDLANTQKASGRISNRQVGKFLTFTITNLPQEFKVYQPSQDYTVLASKLSVGDSITVYFVDSQTANTQVYQVEKNGQIVIDKALLTGQNRTGGLIALVGGLVMMGLAIWQFRKHKR